MSYTNGLDNPELYFQAKNYSGNASTNAITLDGSEDMQPDWVWLKSRSFAQNHENYDSVRGATKRLYNNLTNAEDTNSTGLTGFNSDGFTLGSSNAINKSGETFASWNWKAGTSFSNDASSTGVGPIDSTGSVNTDAGLSIISYTGTGSTGTVAHGLGATPGMIIIKERNNATSWIVYHHKNTSAPATDYLLLNSTQATDDYADYFNDTEPTSSVFTIDTAGDINGSSDTYIAYCFAEKKGYSKFGSYEGNGNNDGTFVYTGFKPAWVMTKSIDSTSNWEIKDNKRSTFNTVDDYIKANANAAEDTGVSSHAMDFLSNGFKHRGSNDEVNGSETYIYMAFAEAPFVNSNGVPNNAR